MKKTISILLLLISSFLVKSQSIDTVYFKKVTLSSSQVKTLNSAPTVILYADSLLPDTNHFFNIIKCVVSLKYNSITYATNTSVSLFENSTNSATASSPLVTAANILNINHSFTSSALFVVPTTSVGTGQYKNNCDVVAGFANGNPTTGNSPVDVLVWYTISPF